jgi:hypothetical protein
MTPLEAACEYLGWQGVTIHDAQTALERIENELIRDIEHASLEENSKRLHEELVTVQVLGLALYQEMG